MSFKDSFDQMVTDIEKLVEDYTDEGYLKADKIGEIIAKQVGVPGRDLNVIFNYISGGRTLGLKGIAAEFNRSNKSVVSAYENGRRALPADVAVRYAEKYGVYD